MLGQIEHYNSETKTGTIKSEDKLFEFSLDNWQADVLPDIGDDIRFELDNDNPIEINLAGAYLEPPKPVKSKYIAGGLALVLGFVGAHRIYLGFYKLALAQIALTAITVGYGALWGFIEAVLIFAGHINKDAKGRPLK